MQFNLNDYLPQNYSGTGYQPTFDLSQYVAPTNFTPMPSSVAPMPELPRSNIGSSINNWMKDSGFLGSRDANGMQTQGWGGLALGAAQGLMNGFLGMKQYGLAKKQFNFQKDAWNQNMANQKKTINTQMEDRQRARVAANPTAYQSVGDYMNQNRL